MTQHVPVIVGNAEWILFTGILANQGGPGAGGSGLAWSRQGWATIPGIRNAACVPTGRQSVTD